MANESPEIQALREELKTLLEASGIGADGSSADLQMEQDKMAASLIELKIAYEQAVTAKNAESTIGREAQQKLSEASANLATMTADGSAATDDEKKAQREVIDSLKEVVATSEELADQKASDVRDLYDHVWMKEQIQSIQGMTDRSGAKERELEGLKMDEELLTLNRQQEVEHTSERDDQIRALELKKDALENSRHQRDSFRDMQDDMASASAGVFKDITDLSAEIRENFEYGQSERNILTGAELVNRKDELIAYQSKLTGLEGGYQHLIQTIGEERDAIHEITELEEFNTVIKERQADLTRRIEDAGRDEVERKMEVARATGDVERIQQRMATMPQGSAEYEAQNEQLTLAKNTLAQSNTLLEDTLNQVKSLTYVKEEYLQKVKDIAEEDGNLIKAQDTVTTAAAEQTNIAKENLELIERHRVEVDQMGTGLQDYAKKWGPIQDAMLDNIDSMKEGMDSFAKGIPIIGGMLSRSMARPMEEAAEKTKKAIVAFSETYRQARAEGDGYFAAMKKSMSAFHGQAKGVATSLMSMIFSPWMLIGIFVVFLVMAFKQLKKYEDAVKDTRKELGLWAQDVQFLHGMTRSIKHETMGWGLEVAKITEAAGALADEFNTTHHVMQETVKLAATFEAFLGIAASETASAISVLQEMGATAADEAEARLMDISNLAAATGTSFKKIIQDISSASEETYLMFKGNSRELAKAVVHARRMGTSLDDMTSAADKLLDFESSINAQMEASSMFGRMVNLDKLRGLAIEGDTVGMANEQMKILKSMGGLHNMNRWQQKAIADAMGVELKTLYKMEAQKKRDKEFQKLVRAGDANAIKINNQRIAAEKKADAEKNMSLAQRLKKRVAENQKQEKFAAMQQKWHDIMERLAEALLPMAEAIMEKISGWMEKLTPEKLEEGLQKVLRVINLILAPFIWLWRIIEAINGEGEGLNDLMEDSGMIIAGIIGTVILFRKVLFALLTGAMSKWFGQTAAIKANTIALQENAAAARAAAASSAGGGGASAAATQTASAAGGTANAMPKSSALLRIAGAMLLFAAALWVLAYALEKFGDVNIEDVLMGAFGLGVLIAGLYVAAKFIETEEKSLIKLAAALLILGIALVPACFALSLLADVNWEGVLAATVALAALMFVTKSLGESHKTIMKGAGALAVLGIAIIPAALAFQLFAGVEWEGVIAGSAALAGLMYVTEALGSNYQLIMKGAGALAVLGVSIIPAALAFQLLSDVDWLGVLFACGVITYLAIVAGILGSPEILPFVEAGALVLLQLAAAMLVFAVAGLVIAAAMWLISDSMMNFVEALQALTWEDIGKMAVLGAMGTFLFVAGILGGIGLAAMGVGAGIAAIGIGALAIAVMLLEGPLVAIMESMVSFVDSLARLGEVGGGLILAGVGLFAVAGGIIAIAIASLAAGFMSLFTFGEDPIEKFIRLGAAGPDLMKAARALEVFTQVAEIGDDLGEGLSGLADGLEDMVESISDMDFEALEGEQMESLSSFISKFSELGKHAEGMEQAASGVKAVGEALSELGKGQIWASIGNLIAEFTGSDPLEKFASLAEHGPNLKLAADAINQLSSIQASDFAELGDAVEPIQELAEGLDGISFAGLSVSSEQLAGMMNMIDQLRGLAEHGAGLKTAAEGLKGMGDAMIDIAFSMMLADVPSIFSIFGDKENEMTVMIKEITKLAKHGDTLPGVADALKTFVMVGELDMSKMKGIDQLGPMLEKLAESASKLDPAVMSSLAPFGEGINALLSALSNNPFTEATDEYGEVLGEVGEGLRNIFDALKNVKDSTISAFSEVGGSLDSMLGALAKNVGKITGSSGTMLRSVGMGLREFFLAFRGVDEDTGSTIKSVGAGVGSMLNAVGKALQGGALPKDAGKLLGEVGEGMEEFFDAMSRADTDTMISLGPVASALAQTLTALNNVSLGELQDNMDVFSELGEALEDFTDSVDEDVVELLQGASTALAPLAPAIAELAKVSGEGFNPAGLTGLGSALEKLANLDLEGLANLKGIFTGVERLASDGFINGMTRATEAIINFATALGKLDEDKLKHIGNIAVPGGGGEQGVTGEEGPLGRIGRGKGTDIPLGQISNTENIETLLQSLVDQGGLTPALGSSKDAANYEKQQVDKLTELIAAVKNQKTGGGGGGDVTMDGKKVGKVIARSQAD